jgi:hypothetical protein
MTMSSTGSTQHHMPWFLVGAAEKSGTVSHPGNILLSPGSNAVKYFCIQIFCRNERDIPSKHSLDIQWYRGIVKVEVLSWGGGVKEWKCKQLRWSRG